MMKKILLFLFLGIIAISSYSQVTTIAPGYKNIIIQSYNPINNYTRAVILLHEAYSGTMLGANHAIGTVTALRGSISAWNRINVANISTSAAYSSTSGSVFSTYNNAGAWKLKTCVFNGKKYLALDIPYDASFFSQGYKFTGWTISTGENMLAVAYEVSGVPVDQNVISDIQDFIPNQNETHDVQSFNVLGSVGIGTTDPKGYKLAVAGNMIAESVKVKLQGSWPDYVFSDDYKLPTLQETERHIKKKGHLLGIPSAGEVKANGIDLGEMNAKLLQKIEELTLHLINLNTIVDKQQIEINKLKTKP